METLMKEQFEDLAGSDGKVTVGAVIDFINGVKDDILTEAQVQDLVKGMDTSGQGSFEEAEFVSVMRKFRQEEYNNINVDDFYKTHFDKIDKDHDGKVSLEGLTAFLLAEDKTGLFSSGEEAAQVITEV